VIETSRLTLRRFRAADRDTVARWNADPEFTRHLSGVQSRAQSEMTKLGFAPLTEIDSEWGPLRVHALDR
jgi:RimJ/RimL family protein N-acetyltransferase